MAYLNSSKHKNNQKISKKEDNIKVFEYFENYCEILLQKCQ